MIDALIQTWRFLLELGRDGFLTVMAIALVAPALGAGLVAQRQPLFALALPQTASLGPLLAWVLFAGAAIVPHQPPPSPATEIVVALTAALVAIAACALTLLQGPRDSGAGTVVLFLLARGAEPLLAAHVPHEEAIRAEGIGRVLTVMPAGRNTVLAVGLAALAAAWVLRHPTWRAALDPDESRLHGQSPQLWRAAALTLFGLYCVGTVPVVGPDVVLTLALVPVTITGRAAWGQRTWIASATIASILGALAAFVFAVQRDWPYFPALIVATTVSSVAVVLVGAALPHGAVMRSAR